MTGSSPGHPGGHLHRLDRGRSGQSYYQQRRVPVPVRVQVDANGDGDYADAGDTRVTRDFSLINSVLDGSTAVLGGTMNLALAVNRQRHGQLGRRTYGRDLRRPERDPGSLTTCSLAPASLAMGSIRFSSPSVMPATGTGAPSTLTINTSGCQPSATCSRSAPTAPTATGSR